MKGLIILVFVFTMMLGVSMVFWSEDIYIGSESCNTEQEHTMFLKAIANPEVHLVSMQSLSSEPPIVVNFVITMPRNEVFPYGEKNVSRQIMGYMFAIVSFIAIIIVILLDRRNKPKVVKSDDFTSSKTNHK